MFGLSLTCCRRLTKLGCSLPIFQRLNLNSGLSSSIFCLALIPLTLSIGSVQGPLAGMSQSMTGHCSREASKGQRSDEAIAVLNIHPARECLEDGRKREEHRSHHTLLPAQDDCSSFLVDDGLSV